MEMFATIARNSLLGLKTGTGRAETSTGDPRPRIARHARLPVADLEGAETTDFDVLLLLERLLDGVEERINHTRAVLLGDHRTSGAGNLGGYTLDQIGFRHEQCL